MLVRHQVSLNSYGQRATLICRTDELFDIIVDYPDSLAALEDLRVSSPAVRRTYGRWLIIQECLAKIDQRDTLVTKLKAS